MLFLPHRFSARSITLVRFRSSQRFTFRVGRPQLAAGVCRSRGGLHLRGAVATGVAGTLEGEPGGVVRLRGGAATGAAHGPDGSNLPRVGGRQKAGVSELNGGSIARRLRCCCGGGVFTRCLSVSAATKDSAAWLLHDAALSTAPLGQLRQSWWFPLKVGPGGACTPALKARSFAVQTFRARSVRGVNNADGLEWAPTGSPLEIIRGRRSRREKVATELSSN